MNIAPFLGLTIALVAAVCAGLIVATVLARVRRRQRERSLARLVARHRMLVLEVASGEDEDGAAAATLAALDRREWSSIAPAVVAMLSKVRGLPADHLVEVLHAHGEVDLALARLSSRSPVRRARGAHLLGLARHEQSVAELIRLLSDPAEEVRLVAARSLGMIRDVTAAGAVLEAVRGTGAQIGIPAWVAAEALLAMGPDAERVVQHGLLDEDPRVRGVAVTVAEHSILPTTLHVLRQRLPDETDAVVRSGIAAALGRIGTADDVACLLRFTTPEEPAAFRRTCVSALGELGHREAAGRLSTLLTDSDRNLAQLSAHALIQLGPSGWEHLHLASTQGEQAARAASGALELARLRGTLPTVTGAETRSELGAS